MSKLYHKVTRQPPEASPEELSAEIEAFLASCRSPSVLEFGEEVIPLRPSQYALEIRSGRLWVDVWHENRSLCRRILSIENRAIGTLDCTVHRFGGAPGKLSFLDLDRPQSGHKTLSGHRHSFGEQFRRMLFRQFPGWEIETLSSSMDLRRSLSPIFPRARVTKANQQIAAMACPDMQDEGTLLTFALIWFDYVQAHPRHTGSVTRLCLFLPEEAGRLTAHRLRWLNRETTNPCMFRFNSHGSAGEVDPDDLGNLDTRLIPPVPPPDAPAISPAVAASFLHSPPEQTSERWLEFAVRSALNLIDASLLESPIHGQVLTFAAADRDIIDLLAASASGGLAVIELKTVEDIHLPIQALDYWMRIMWHSERGELGPLFPAVALSKAPPRLLLIAPALSFHPTTTTVLRYFSPRIDVERVGLNSEWQRGLRVVLRLSGANDPQSHGSSYGYTRSSQHQEGYLKPES